MMALVPPLLPLPCAPREGFGLDDIIGSGTGQLGLGVLDRHAAERVRGIAAPHGVLGGPVFTGPAAGEEGGGGKEGARLLQLIIWLLGTPCLLLNGPLGGRHMSHAADMVCVRGGTGGAGYHARDISCLGRLLAGGHS